MLATKTLTAKILTVHTAKLNDDNAAAGEFKVYEFDNGLILVPSASTNDWFFEDSDSIEACGNDVVTEIEDTGTTVTWTARELLESIQSSMKEFGIDSVPSKHVDLWK